MPSDVFGPPLPGVAGQVPMPTSSDEVWSARAGLTVRDPVERGEVAARVDAGLHVVHRGRAVGRPGVLVPAHPLQTHRLADRLRDDRRADVDVGLAARAEHAAERARALVEDAADLLRRQPEVRLAVELEVRQRRRHARGLLRVGEDRDVIRLHVGDRARRADRHVPVVGVLVRRRHRLRRRLERGVHVADVRRVAGGVRRVRIARLAHPRPEVARAGQLRIALPDHLQLRRRLDRVVLLRRHDREEVPDLDDLDVRDVLDRRSRRRSAGSGSAR